MKNYYYIFSLSLIIFSIPFLSLSEQNQEILNDEKQSIILKTKENIRFLGRVKFFKEVEIKENLTIESNINMKNSIDSSVGNIFKNGSRFIHNSGKSNTFVGFDAGSFEVTGYGNSGFGNDSLLNISAGFGNTGLGFSTLVAHTTGNGNTAAGSLALSNNTTGNINSAFGFLSLESNTTGEANSSVGYYSLNANTTGNENTALGTASLASNTIGNGNIAVGIGSLFNNITGSRNIALGYNSGFALTAGDNNIYIANTGVALENGTIRIGTFGTHTSTFMEGIFGSVVGGSGLNVEVDSTGKLGTVMSSKRFKTNIVDMNTDSDGLYRLRPVAFIYNTDETELKQYGLIAEEVADSFPELVIFDEDNQAYAVRYQVLPALLLNEVQKHYAMIQALTKRLEQLEARA